MAKTKPIGVRFDEMMVKHFREERGVESHQTMLNVLWADYASRNGLWNGSVKVVDITSPKNKTNYTIDTTIDAEEIKRQIQIIRDEKIPKERDTPLGRGVWKNDQAKRINELYNQLPKQ